MGSGVVVNLTVMLGVHLTERLKREMAPELALKAIEIQISIFHVAREANTYVQ